MGDEMRACPDCGAENANNARFCSQCATPLETTQAQEIEALEAAAAADTTEAVAKQPTAVEDAVEEPTAEHTDEKLTAAQPVPAAATPPGSFTITREKALVGGGVLVALIAGIAVALAVSLSGQAAKPKPQRASATQTESEPAQTNPLNMEDTDGDGIPDASDSDPYSAADSSSDASTDEFDNAPSEDDDSYLDDTEEETTHTSVSVGEAGVDDDVTFKVLSLEAVSSIQTDEFSDGPITPKAGAKLVKAVVIWKNNMNKSASIFCGGGSALLLDQNGRNFDPIDNQIDIAGNGLCDDVQPGFKQTVTLAFQMPKDSNTTELVLWNDDAEDDFDGEQSDVRVLK
jgi:hypothetical protein